jgi:hypothetical protein
MWQTVVVLLVAAAVLIHVIRYYVRAARCGVLTCGGCRGCCNGEAQSRSQGE